MKKIITAVMVGALSLMTVACSNSKDIEFVSSNQQIAYKQTAFVVFDNLPYYFTYGSPTVNEFIPRGEDINEWQSLVATRVYPEITSVNRVMALALAELDDDCTPFEIVENKMTGMAGVHYVKHHMSYDELNVWKFMPNRSGGVIGYRFAKRFTTDRDIQNYGRLNRSYYVQKFLGMKNFPFIY